jgi:hypothetical protein
VVFEALDIAVGGSIHERKAGLTSVNKGKKTTKMFKHVKFMHFIYRLNA